ncbi:hypothetical protein HQO42_18800 [Rhodococcus fascians]|nr:hypothetical protein [Rhodococcus fascians]MBY4238705.1 hypothetical protein [Rhodococcus fascians]MBY4254706.1 hypothetical protein [Rhodococcus fascians]MBY4270060.1 hypothetical protein [Rhodococcus fascians]
MFSTQLAWPAREAKPPLVWCGVGVADVRSSGIGATAPGGHPSAIYAPIPTLVEPGEADGFVAG